MNENNLSNDPDFTKLVNQVVAFSSSQHIQSMTHTTANNGSKEQVSTGGSNNTMIMNNKSSKFIDMNL